MTSLQPKLTSFLVRIESYINPDDTCGSRDSILFGKGGVKICIYQAGFAVLEFMRKRVCLTFPFKFLGHPRFPKNIVNENERKSL
jgi:hypothetical protein